jgi:hypothetical protein
VILPHWRRLFSGLLQRLPSFYTRRRHQGEW